MRIARCAVVASILFLFSLCCAFAEDTVPASQPPETIHVTLLPVQKGFSVRVPCPIDETVSFKKEPTYEGKKILRSIVPTSEDQKEGIAFAWDETARKLYVDFNNNLDLTDDPESVYKGTEETSRGGLHAYDIRLQRKINGVNVLSVADFNFYDDRMSFDVKSGWASDFEVNGQRWCLGIGDNFYTKIPFQDDQISGSLFLTPGDTDSAIIDQNLGHFPTLIQNPVFFSGVTGKFTFVLTERLVPGSDKRQVVVDVTLQYERPETFPVRLTGNFIDYLILRRSDPEQSFALFKQPGNEIRLPAGDYTLRYVTVGKDPAFRSYSFFESPPFSVGPGQEAVLNVGGPLQKK